MAYSQPSGKMLAFPDDAQYEIKMTTTKNGYSSPVMTANSDEERGKKRVELEEGTNAIMVGVDASNPYWYYIKLGAASDVIYCINVAGSDAGVATINSAENKEKEERADKIVRQNDTYSYVFDQENVTSTLDEIQETTSAPTGDVILIGTTNPSEINLTYRTQTANNMIVTVSAYGSPPQWTQYADPRIMSVRREKIDLEYTVGRRYAETVISQPTILSLCPGIIEFNAKAIAAETNYDDVSQLIMGATENLGDLKDALNGMSGKLVRFTPTWDPQSRAVMSTGTSANVSGYIAYVNTLSKIFVAYLGRNADINNNSQELHGASPDAAGQDLGPLQNRLVPKIGGYYKDLDWKEIDGKVDNSIFLFENGSAEQLNYPFVNFYVSGQLSVDESFDTTVRSSTIEDMLNGQVGATMKDIAFITGRAIGNSLVEEDVQRLMSESSSKFGGILGNIFKDGMEFFRGGKVVLPQIVDDCTYGKSCQFTCKFISPAGDVESIFWNVIAPYFHLLPFVLPQQIGSSLDMYSYPFMCKAACKGLFNCPMGVVRGFRVNRGGSDNELWTNEGIPTEIEVQFEITPLYTKLMLSENNSLGGPAKFIKNTGLQEYVATLTGVDMRLGELDLKVQTALSLVRGWFVNIPDAIMSNVMHSIGLYDLLHNAKELNFFFNRF